MTQNITENNNTHTQQKVVSVAIIGEPNTGKSTLLNTIIGQKISIVTHKVQTTRENIRGIFCDPTKNLQYVFTDTPGIFDPTRRIERYIVKNAISGLLNVDTFVLMIDAKRGITDFFKENLLKLINQSNNKLRGIAVINKTDLVDKERLFEITDFLKSYEIFDHIVAISALKRLGCDTLLELLAGYSKNMPWLYDPDYSTDTPVRTIAEEITREKIYLQLHRELPYSIKVETDKWQEEEERVVIYQSIFVLKESQKTIVLGKNGIKIKTIGIQARKEIEDLIGKPVNLQLHVKVREDWIERDFKSY